MDASNSEVLILLRRLTDRQQIFDCLMRYCRAMDRLDRELLLSCYHPDAIDDHGLFLGNREQFADWAFALHRELQECTHHVITNHICELAEDIAHTESYFLYAGLNRQGPRLSICGGRYIDRFERREGKWAIAARQSIREWDGAPGDMFVQVEPTDPSDTSRRPTRDRSDPSYRRPFEITARTPAFRIRQ